MPLGIISLTILLAIGAFGFGLMTIRLGRVLIMPNASFGPITLAGNAAMFVIAVACGLGALHFYQQIGG